MHDRHFTIEEDRRVPLDGVVFGWLPMLPIHAGALLSLIAPAPWVGQAMVLWASAIILFLAGVRRGLSFRTPGGPRLIQLVTMLGLFLAGLAALVLPVPASSALLTGAYASLAVLDPVAARRAEVPLYFARLRPWQMGSAAVALLVLTLSGGS